MRLSVKILLMLCCTLFFISPLFAYDKKNYCSGLYNCLAEKPSSCEDSACEKNPKIKYNTDFCDVFRRLKDRGLGSDSSWGKRIYSHLGMKHRVAYSLDGTLPVSAPVMEYVMNNLPFAARLINAYQGTTYTAEYLKDDKTKFRADNADDLSGVFNSVLQDSEQFQTVFYGTGSAKIMMWKLAGTALVFFDYDPVDLKTIAYRFTCIVFPSNAFLKSVMNFFLFRKVVLGIVEEMIDYVQSSTKEFAKGNVKPIDRYPWFSSPEGIKEREKFQQVIKGNY